VIALELELRVNGETRQVIGKGSRRQIPEDIVEHVREDLELQFADPHRANAKVEIIGWERIDNSEETISNRDQLVVDVTDRTDEYYETIYYGSKLPPRRTECRARGPVGYSELGS